MWFVVVTMIHFILRYVTSTKAGVDPETRRKNQQVWTGIYFLLLLVGEYFINLSLTKKMCGSAQYPTSFYMTFAPWVLIFGVLNVMLLVFPGWISPFSNTVGYGVAKLAGISGVMGKIFRFKTKGSSDAEGEDGGGDSLQTKELLGRIYADKGLLLNEITQESFNDFWANMWPLFRPGITEGHTPADPNPLKHKLLSMVILKDSVGLLCWYLLAGMVVVGVSYNYLMNSGCTRSAEEIKARHDEFLRKEEAIKQENEEVGPPRVYTDYGQ